MPETGVNCNHPESLNTSRGTKTNLHGLGLPPGWLCLPGRVLRCFGLSPGEALRGTHVEADSFSEGEDALDVDASSGVSSTSHSNPSRPKQEQEVCATVSDNWSKVSSNARLLDVERDEKPAFERRRSYSATSFTLPAVRRSKTMRLDGTTKNLDRRPRVRESWHRGLSKLLFVSVTIQTLILLLALCVPEWRSMKLYAILSIFNILSSGSSWIIEYRFAQDSDSATREPSKEQQSADSPSSATATQPIRRNFGSAAARGFVESPERSSPEERTSLQRTGTPVRTPRSERSFRTDDATEAFMERAPFDARSNRRVFAELGVESSQSLERSPSDPSRGFPQAEPVTSQPESLSPEMAHHDSAAFELATKQGPSVSDREPSAVSDIDTELSEREIRGQPDTFVRRSKTGREHFSQRSPQRKERSRPSRLSKDAQTLAVQPPDQSTEEDVSPWLEDRRPLREASGLSDDLAPAAVKVESLRIVHSWENMRVTNKNEIIAEDFCEGMLSLLSVIDALGPAFRIIKIDIRNHVGGIRKYCTKYGCRTLQRLVDAESNRASRWLNLNGIGEGTEHILWMKRAMQFVYMLLQMFVDGAELELCVYHAYRQTLRPCHPYIVRKVAENLHRFVPTRSGFVRRIHADERFVLAQMKRLLEAIPRRLDVLVELYNANNLEPDCRRTCAELRQLALVCLEDQPCDDADE